MAVVKFSGSDESFRELIMELGSVDKYFCLALSPITVPVLLVFFFCLFVYVFMCIPVWAKHK